MIQRYTCVPTTEYDVFIVTNGTISQVESKLIEINEKINNEIPLHSNFTYLDDFKLLITALQNHHKRNRKLMSNVYEGQPPTAEELKFKGKVLFMFFNGVEFIQNILSDIIDYFNAILQEYGKKRNRFEVIANAYFYFDCTISMPPKSAPSAVIIDDHLFLSIVTIANDMLKKITFMVERVRGVFIDDIQLAGEKVYPLRSLVRNFPNIERVELTSFTNIMMKDMIV